MRIFAAQSFWLPWALMSLVTYSFWGIFNGLSSRQIEPYSALFYSAFGYLIAGIIALFFIDFRPELTFKGSLYGIAIGLATGLGGLFLLVAIGRGGSSSIVVAITSVYPLATLIFNLFILHEHMTLKQGIAIIFTIIAMLMMAI